MSIDALFRDKIKTLAIDLSIGASTPAQICPFCGGGDTKDKSFSVVRYDNILYYQCFRAKCGEKGIVPTSVHGFIPESKPRKIRKYYGHTQKLSEHNIKHIEELWGILPDELSSQGFAQDDEDDSLVMPLFTYQGYDAGVILRRMDGRKPKTLAFWSEDVPKVHFPVREAHTSSCFVVEDIPSAIKASRYMSSAALCGTGMGEDVVALLSTNFHTLYLALDADATQKAISYMKKYRLSFGNFLVVPLSKDIKNMKNEEIDSLMGGLIGETASRSIP